MCFDLVCERKQKLIVSRFVFFQMESDTVHGRVTAGRSSRQYKSSKTRNRTDPESTAMDVVLSLPTHRPRVEVAPISLIASVYHYS